MVVGHLSESTPQIDGLDSPVVVAVQVVEDFFVHQDVTLIGLRNDVILRIELRVGHVRVDRILRRVDRPVGCQGVGPAGGLRHCSFHQ
jgi:hypothetical protein